MKKNNIFFSCAFLFTLFICSCSKINKNSQEITSNIQENDSIEIKKEIDDPNQKYVYITFDDGPNKGTENLMNIIEKNKIPISCFLIGLHTYSSDKQKKDYERLKNIPYIELVNHSFSHAYKVGYKKFYEDQEKLLHDFQRNQDSLKFNSTIARTPSKNTWLFNNINKVEKKVKSKIDYLAENKFQLVGWDLEWAGKNMKLKEDSQTMINKIDSFFNHKLNTTENHLVLLSHDQYLQDSVSVKELQNLITLLKNKNYQLRKISQYPGIIK